MLQKGHLCRYFLSNCQKDFFFFHPFILSKFCYRHSQNCLGVTRNDPNMSHRPKAAGGKVPPCPVAVLAAGRAWWWPHRPHLTWGCWRGRELLLASPVCARGRGNISARFIEGAKKGLKSCPAVCICYCDLNVNTLRRDFNFCTLSASLLRPPCILSSSSTVKFTQKRQQFDS